MKSTVFAFLSLMIPHLFSNEPPRPTVAVIGAGLAGLTAAYRLHEQGYDVSVYEARARAGGRVLTLYFGQSHEELGGKFINDGAEGKNIVGLAQELGLEIESYKTNYTKACLCDDQIHSYHSLVHDFLAPSETLFSSLQEKARTAKNLGEILDAFFEGQPQLRKYAEIRMRNFEGSATSELSPYYLESFWNFYQDAYELGAKEKKGEIGKYAIETIKGGNCRLIEALCEKLKGCIHYKKPLVKIQRAENGQFHLFFSQDDSVVIDYLLFSLPCSTLREVEVEEGIIPDDQWSAIQTLQYGSNAKILLPITKQGDSRYEFAYTERGVLWFNADHSIMTCYYGGAAGLFFSPTQMLKEEAATIEKIYPDMVFSKDVEIAALLDKPYVRSLTPIAISWMDEKFSKGSYSVFGAEQGNAIHKTQQDWQEPIRSVFRSIEGKIFFAGEHTAVDFPATMEGAVESGEKAARMMQRALLLPSI